MEGEARGERWKACKLVPTNPPAKVRTMEEGMIGWEVEGKVRVSFRGGLV